MGVLLERDNMFATYIKITFNGVELTPDQRRLITNVEIEESDSEADLGRISVSDNNFEFSNNIPLAKKVPVTIDMGFEAEHRVMLVGEVTHVEADFGEDGVPKLVIGCIDNTNKMSTIKKTREWKKKKISDVVRSIAAEHGYIPLIQDTKEIEDKITQDDETDTQFISKCADNEAFHWYLIEDEKKLFFGDRINSALTSEDTLEYNKGNSAIINFRPNLVEKNKNSGKNKANQIDAGKGKSEAAMENQATPPKTSKQVKKAKPVLVVDGKRGSSKFLFK